MQKLHLYEAKTEKHWGKAPATFYAGSNTIDGIYVSRNILISQGGYIDETYCPGNHHWLWIDIPKNMILGEAKDEEVMPVKRRVTSKIPRIRNKFNSLINKQIKIHRLRETINTVKEKAIKEMKED